MQFDQSDRVYFTNGLPPLEVIHFLAHNGMQFDNMFAAIHLPRIIGRMFRYPQRG
jgi:hypothetical protein